MASINFGRGLHELRVRRAGLTMMVVVVMKTTTVKHDDDD